MIYDIIYGYFRIIKLEMIHNTIHFFYTHLLRIIKAFIHSINGLKTAIIRDISFKQELFLSFLSISFVIYYDLPQMHKVLMISSVIFILISELINSAIEIIIDRISTKYHQLSKYAKDLGSAIVLLAFINAIMTWIILLK